MRLLLVEDDAELSQSLKKSLEQAGFAIDTADNGVDGEFMGKTEPYDLIILDLGLPQRSGLEVLKNWRRAGLAMLVLILTARDEWHERVEGFKTGADDYLGKPFHVEEVIARVNALIHRSKQQQSGSIIKTGDLILDEEYQTVSDGKKLKLELTGTEFRLLRYFMLHPGKIISKTTITEHVYDYDSDKDSNVIEVYVNKLRQKLGKQRIETRWGQGYIFKEYL
ncbi:Two-component transcriptional response regulator, LuxR family [hydrothermal vent metagenome]|uniref:Two-component transcriptional response regulator, LuxR family n=1 Tax=hydrothermal vent metagenome TaxID=652676 RepID=A0A3B1BCC1_9ZZZZ